MKAISVRQPFATDICFGEKTIELRTWQTAYRGELIICSSRAGVKTWLLKDGVYYQAPMGATICKVNLVDCRPATKADADDAYCNPEDITDGMWAWVLEDVVDLEPKPVKAIELKPEVPTQKPIARVQTATVVAPDGEEIDTDEYGRIKVKFHWDKPSLQDRRLFEPLEVKDINTCWLRVSTAWAGENYGAIQLPRAGQEVIVDFFGGDPNMPFVSGRLTNPDNMPVWQLPNEKVLSGLKSKEYQGSQSNQLVMDDTTGKLQVQLKSDHQSSELNLGSITRINPVQGRADFRGKGLS